MRANRRKGCDGVLKLLIDTFFPIMAGATIGRIVTEVGNHESSIQLQVTVSAVAGFKGFVTIDMTGLAGERCAIWNF